jgi:hypothetical protein
MMVDHHGHLHLVDFGLTRALQSDADHSVAGHIRGTPWYMSPEQARGDVIDRQSDIYSLGVTLYEMLSHGTGPYTASRQNSEAVLKQVKQGEYLPLRVVSPDVPPEVERIVQKAMQFNPRRRYGDAQEMADELERILTVSSLERTASKPGIATASWPARRWMLLTGAMLGLLAVIILWKLLLPSATSTSGVDSSSAANPSRTEGPFPKAIGELPVNGSYELFRPDGAPDWHRRILGAGTFAAANNPPKRLLFLQCFGQTSPTMLAIADCAGLTAFEFSIEMQLDGESEKGQNQAGIFLGYDQASEQGTPRRFLNVQLVRNAENKEEFRVGTGRLAPARGAQAQAVEWFRPIRQEEATIPLNNPIGFRHLRARVLGDTLELTADHVTRRVLELKKLRELYSRDAESLQWSGALGVWAANDKGNFRDARFTRLESP